MRSAATKLWKSLRTSCQDSEIFPQTPGTRRSNANENPDIPAYHGWRALVVSYDYVEKVAEQIGDAVAAAGTHRTFSLTTFERIIGFAAWSVLAMYCSPCFFPGFASAQNNPNNATLFSRSLGTKEDPSRSVEHLFGPQGVDGVGTSILDAVQNHIQGQNIGDEVLSDQNSNSSFSSYYRSYYFTHYFGETTNENDDMYSPEVREHIAERVAAYQAVNSISGALLDSPISNVYREFTETVLYYRDFLTMRVSRNSSGSYDIGQHASKKNQVIEFRLNANVQRGIEPTVKFGEDFSLKYDAIEKAPIFEYHVNF